MNSQPGSWRYPGARSFDDTDLDRRLFFGRDRERETLLHTVLSDPLMVLYAKSGTGKSSLLKAGLKKALRERGCLPLIARVNDPKRAPWEIIFDYVLEAARQQQVEILGEDRSSALNFFSKLELWRGDTLLTPVLVIDQFEELFTMHDRATRAAFYEQFASIVRRDAHAADGESSGRLALRVVISIREDYLGNLEELAPWVPNILNVRVRLNALSAADAATAIEGPAAVRDPALSTAPFRYAQDTVGKILKFLSVQTSPHALDPSGIEPFQLQLICHYVEQTVAQASARGASEGSELVVDYQKDLGGDEGLQRIVGAFFNEQIAELALRFPRGKILNLCERGLISRGRRLSLEEGEIERRFGLGQDALAAMVDCRLLRAEPRLGSIYYELSHDTLIEPVRAASAQISGRRKRRLIGASAAAGVLLLGVASYFVYQKMKERHVDQLTADAAGLVKSRPDEALMTALAAAQQATDTEIEPDARILQVAFDSGVAPTTLVRDLHLAQGSSMTLSPTGRLAAIARDGGVDLVNRSGALVQRLESGTGDYPTVIQFNRSGDLLAAVSERGIFVWTVGGKLLAGPIETRSKVASLALHPALPMLVTVDADGRLETIAYGQLPADSPPPGALGPIPGARSVRFSPHGSHLLVLTNEGKVILQSVAPGGGSMRAALEIERESPNSVASAWPYIASVNGKNGFISIGKVDGKSIRAQEILARIERSEEKDLEIARLAPKDPEKRGFRDVEFAADARVLVATSNDNTASVFVRNDSNGQSSWRMRGTFKPLPQDQSISRFAIRVAESPTIAFASTASREVVVTDLDGKTVSRETFGKGGEITDLEYLGDGTLVVGWESGEVSIWTPQKQSTASNRGAQAAPRIGDDAATERRDKRVHAPSSPVTGITAIPGRPAFLLFDSEGRFEIWEAPSARLIGMVCLRKKPDWSEVATDGKRIAVLTASGTWLFENLDRVLTEARAEPPPSFKTTTCESQDDSRLGRRLNAKLHAREEDWYLPILIDGNRIIETSQQLDFRASDFHSYESKDSEPIRDDFPARHFVAAEFVGPSEIVAGDADGELVFWNYDPKSQRPHVEEATRAQAHGGAILNIAASVDGSRLVTSGEDGQLHVWSRTAMRVPETSISISQPQEAVAIDGQLAVSGTAGKLLLHDIGESGRNERGREESTAEDILAVDPKRRYFISKISESNRLLVSDLQTGAALTWTESFDYHCVPVAAAIAMEGEKISVGCEDGSVEMVTPSLDIRVGPRNASDGNAIVALAYDMTRRYLAAGDSSGRVTVWNERDEVLGESWNANEDSSGSLSLALLKDTGVDSPGGTNVPMLATSGSDRPGSIQIWRFDGETFRKDITLESETRREIVRLIALADGRLISIAADSAYKDSEIRLWNVATKESVALPHPAPVLDAMLDHAGRVQTIDRAQCLRRWAASTSAEKPAVDLSLALSLGACESVDAAREDFSARFTADGTELVTTGASGRRIWPAHWKGWIEAACRNARRSAADGSAAHTFCSGAHSGESSGPESVLASITDGGSREVQAVLIKGEAIDVKDAGSRTALALAAHGGSADLVTILLAHGADPKLSDAFGMTLAHHAAWSADARTIDIVLDSVPDSVRPDNDGVTPTMIAASRGILHTTPRLNLAGGIEMASASGLTPLMIAAAYGNSDDVTALIASGADVNKTFRTSSASPQTAWLLRGRALDGDWEKTYAALEAQKPQFNAKANWMPRLWLAPPNISRWQNEADQMLAWQQGGAPGIAPEKVIESLAGAAKSGDAEALLLLGLARTVGFGTQRDDAQALKDFQAAATMGFRYAEAVAFMSQLNGRGTSQPVAQAANQLQERLKNPKLAEIPLANYLQWIAVSEGLKEMASEDRDVESLRAMESLKRFAQSGDPLIPNSLGVDITDQYAHRSEPDIHAESELLLEAVKSNDPVAWRNMAHLFESMHKYDEAIDAHKKSWAGQQTKTFFPWSEIRGSGIYSESAAPLAYLFLYRDRPEEEEAMKWMRLGAAGKDSNGALLLAWSLEGGFGVAPNPVEAVKYYRQAAAAGSDFAWARLEALGVGP